MSAEKVYVGTIGTRIRLRVFEDSESEDLSGATSPKIYYLKPDGTTTGSWTATLDTGTDKHLYYDTVATTDLDQSGEWLLQSYHEKSGWEGRGETVALEVYENYE
jgi:hypothetical protein